MKYALFIPFAATLLVANSFAQNQIYRCGNEYINNAADAKTRGCKLVEGGNITIVEGTRVSPTESRTTPVRVASNAPAATPGVRVDAGDQRNRDNETRAILDAELKKTEARQAELLKEYNNGEPEKMGSESRNHQKYLDRVADLKASIARNESDIASIRRELGRSGAK